MGGEQSGPLAVELLPVMVTVSGLPTAPTGAGTTVADWQAFAPVLLNCPCAGETAKPPRTKKIPSVFSKTILIGISPAGLIFSPSP
jgi:hypothetical protein